jgi:hypothetical protein
MGPRSRAGALSHWLIDGRNPRSVRKPEAPGEANERTA